MTGPGAPPDFVAYLPRAPRKSRTRVARDRVSARSTNSPTSSRDSGYLRAEVARDIRRLPLVDRGLHAAAALVCARLVAIAATSLTRQLPITHATTRPTAHALCRDRRDRRHEHPTALGTSTAHARESAPSASARPWVGHDPAAAPDLITRRVDHDPAAKWISTKLPLKPMQRARIQG